MARVVEDVRNRLTAAAEAGELTPAVVARLIATVNAHAQLAGVDLDAPVEEDLPARRVLVAPGITIDEARDAAWAQRRRRADVDD